MGGAKKTVKRTVRKVSKTVSRAASQAAAETKRVAEKAKKLKLENIALAATKLASDSASTVLKNIIPTPDINIEGDAADVDSTIPGGAPIEEATLSEFEDEELDRRKKASKKRGAKTLRIPLGGVTGKTIGTGR